jgi:phenylacetate-coenzyme A ligase PaaK-like adenylate-forming protein
LQLERLRWSVRHAYDHVAHYHQAFDAAGYTPTTSGVSRISRGSRS